MSTNDPKGEAGKKKAQLQLIPPVLNTEVARAIEHGSRKYGPWNWRTARVEIMTYIGAMKRHIDAVLNREDLDPESGAHHLGHVAASCGIVMDAAQNGTLVDNRPPAFNALAGWEHAGKSISIGPGGEPPAKSPLVGMTLTTFMEKVKRGTKPLTGNDGQPNTGTVFSINQYTAIELAIAHLFEPVE